MRVLCSWMENSVFEPKINTRFSFNLQSRRAYAHNVRNARITTFQIRLKQAVHRNLACTDDFERIDQIQKKVVTIKSVYLYRFSQGSLIAGL